MFHDALPAAERYAELLAHDATVRGLIGPREVPRLWERHLLNCAAVAAAVPDGSSVCDIGSGAGLPGLVLAIARPDLTLELVEPLLRRTTFLEEVAADLALDNVVVTRGRAELLYGVRQFDVVTSRAVAPMGRLLEWSMPLVAPHGAMVAMKGSSAQEEIDEAAHLLARLRCAPPEIVDLPAPDASSTTRVVRVSWADPARVSLPRRNAQGSGNSSKRKGPS